MTAPTGPTPRPRDPPAWIEVSLCREIYGILQTLATRPLSKGHDGAMDQARVRLASAAGQLVGLHHRLLSKSQADLIGTMVGLIDQIPPEVIARTLIGPLGNVLGQGEDAEAGFPCCFVADPKPCELHHLVVSVGPTIGLGDEVLAARALLERARAFDGLRISVSSWFPALWTEQDPDVRMLPSAPYAAYEFIESLSPRERERTSHLFVDFMATDLSPDPYQGPGPLALGGRWSMGSRECDLVQASTGLRFRSRYPAGLPDNRWLEARWMAARVLPGQGRIDRPRRQVAARGGPQRVLLQPLTAKPSLTFANRYYVDVFRVIAGEMPELELQLIPSPTPKGQAQIELLLRDLRAVVPGTRIEQPQATSLADVFDRLKRADVLFGPDTFTGHIAALLGLPQATISLPEHRAWRSIGAPALAIVADRSIDELVEVSARSVLAFLRLRQAAQDAWFLDACGALRTQLSDLAQVVCGFLDHRVFDCTPAILQAVDAVLTLQHELLPQVEHLLGQRIHSTQLPRLDLQRFDHPADQALALARWLHAVELGPIAAIAAAAD